MRYLFSICVLLISSLAWPQSVGVVQGTITDPTGAVIPGATVTLTSAVSGYRQSVTSDAQGQYRFINVPFAQFTVHAEAPGFDHQDQTGELRTNVPLAVNVKMVVATSQQTVEVTESAPLLETTSAGTHHDIDYLELQKTAIPSGSSGVESVVKQVPGVVQDDNGRIHVRGSESQVQYVVDGVPITDNVSAAFATSISTDNLRSTEIVTGNVPAEYGSKLGAVVNINSKSGLEMPLGGSVSFNAGSFNSQAMGLELGGHRKNFGAYLSADVSKSDRYLDPPAIENYHNSGGNSRLFTKFDWNATSHDVFRLLLSTDGTDFQVPNRPEQQLLGQRVRQELRGDSEALGYNHVFTDSTIGDFVIYRRSMSARLLDPLLTGFPYYATQARRQRTEGLRASISTELKGHSLKAGFQTEHVPLSERFTVAATDPAILTDPTQPASAFTLAHPFLFNQKDSGSNAAVYVQDRFTILGHLTVDGGLRFDHYDQVISQNHLSPRIGLAYYVKRTGTVLRGSYNNLFQTPPNENLLLSSSPAGAVFSLLASPLLRAVPPETTNFYEVGAQQRLGKYVRLDVSHYVKNIRNFSDKDQLLDTGIIFPVAIARGDIRGQEARLDLTPYRGFTAFISYANSKAVGTTPLVGGLFLGDATSSLLVPGVQFLADHDERNESQFGVTYSAKKGWWTSFDGRFDSGVPSDFDPAALLSSGVDPRFLPQLDLVRLRVKPREIFGISAGADLFRESHTPISLQFSVENITDRFYLYNFQSVFSGTHVGRPRDFSGRLVFHFGEKNKKS